MWLTLDLGNSALKGGLFDGPRLQHTFRIALDRPRSGSSWPSALKTTLDGHAIDRVGIASVVPDVLAVLCELLSAETGRPPDVVHHEMTLPFTLAYETPDTLGTDRLAAAAAAWTMFGHGDTSPRSVVALDAGTALTLEVVDRTGVFRGGVIAPGPQLMRQALSQGTAQLPDTPLTLPEQPIGRSTREAIQVGIMYGLLESVRGMLNRLRTQLGAPPFVVATGGWSAFLREHLDGIDRVEPHLVLHGIRVLMELNE